MKLGEKKQIKCVWIGNLNIFFLHYRICLYVEKNYKMKKKRIEMK